MSSKFFSILFVALVASTFSFAQGLHVGVKGGAKLFKIDGKSFNEEFKYGYNAGLFAEINLSQKVGIQPEILWNQINSDTAGNIRDVYDNLGNQDLKNPQLNYLSIPLLLSYKPSKFLSLQAGPQYGILLNNNKSFFENGKEAFKNGDFSLLMGVQLKILSARVYGRYMIGLNNLNDLSSQEKWKTTGFQVGLGLAL